MDAAARAQPPPAHEAYYYHQQQQQQQPPLPPNPPLPPTLTQLFQELNIVAAAKHIRNMDSGQAKAEIPDAFLFVPTAPSSFLLCINVLVQEERVMKHLDAIETAIVCIRSMSNPLISAADSTLAGSLLWALQTYRIPLLSGFVVAYRVPEGALAAFCEHVLAIKAYTAIQLMESLHMKHLVPVEVVLAAAIAQDDVRAGDIFVKRNKEHQHLYVNMLLNSKVGDKIVKKRITDFKLDINAFPAYARRKKLSALRYLVYTDRYEDALRFVADAEDLKEYVCRVLFDKKGAGHPATRHFVRSLELAHIFPYVDVNSDVDVVLPPQDEYEPLDSCVSLADCIGVENIVFVDTLEGLQACVEHLEVQSVIGFDCEWKANHIPGANSAATMENPCATLQLASAHKAFVLDIIALGDISGALVKMFGDESILKLGFDTKGDLKLLRAILGQPHGGHGPVVSGLLDLQAVTRKLYAQGVVAAATNGVEDTEEEKNEEESVPDTVVESSDVAAPDDGNAEKKDTKRKKKKQRRVGGGGNAKNSLALAGVAEMYLGKPLDKRARMSDWERRPLTRAQLHYAALDAYVLVRIFQQMQLQHPEDVFASIVNRCTQKNLK